MQIDFDRTAEWGGDASDDDVIVSQGVSGSPPQSSESFPFNI